MIPGSPQYNPYPHQTPPPSPQPTIIVQQGKSSSGGMAAVIVISVVVALVAITIVISGVLYVWASSLAADSGGPLEPYAFNDRDAIGEMSDSGGDSLVHIQMSMGESINWAVLDVKISVDGGPEISCQHDNTDSECTFTGSSSNSWDAPEEITISEGDNYDLCDGYDGGCIITVEIIKIGIGNDSDTLLAIIDSYADASQ